MAKQAKTKHVGTRVTPITEAQLDLIKDLRGFPSISALMEDYIMTGLKLDSTNIESKIEERLALEKQRLMALASGVNNLSDSDSEDDDLIPEAEDEDDDDGTLFDEVDEDVTPESAT